MIKAGSRIKEFFETRLGESDEAFRHIFNISPEGIILLDKSGKIIDLNRKIYDWLGYMPEEIIGKNILRLPFIPVESKAKIIKKSVKEIVSQEIKPYTISFITKDGEKRIGRVVSSYIKNKTGKRIAELVMVSDVTDETLKDIKLEESEQRYRILFETANDGILIADSKTQKFYYANPAICRMLGYSEEELKRMSVSDIHPKKDLKYVVSVFEAQARGNETLAPDIPCLRKDGTVIYADINAVKSLMNDKECNVGFFRDISERKINEEKLLASEAKFRTVMEKSPMGIIIVDKDRKIRDVNEAAATMISRDKRDIIGKVCHHFICPRAQKDCPIYDHGDDIKRMECVLLSKDKNEIPIEKTITKMTIDGEEMLLEMFSDITEKKKTDKILKDSKIKLQLLYDSSSDAIMLLDEKGFFDCNEATLRLFGCTSKEEFCSRHPADFSPPTQPDGTDSMSYVKKNIVFALKNGSKRFEHLHRRLDDTNFPAEVLLDALVLGGKKVLQARVYDITERKKAEERIKESEEKYRLLADNSIDCIWILDNKLRFTYISPSVERILGIKPEQCVGTKLSSHFKKKEFLKVGALATKAIINYKTFTHVTFETKMLNSKNEEVNIEISSKALLNSQGKLIGIQGITRDITERKQTEEQLNIFKTFAETSNHGMGWTDIDGNIVYVNPALTRLLGEKNQKAILGKNVAATYYPENEQQKLREKIFPYVVKGGTWSKGEINTDAQ